MNDSSIVYTGGLVELKYEDVPNFNFTVLYLDDTVNMKITGVPTEELPVDLRIEGNVYGNRIIPVYEYK